jgi:hypothetical protein
MKNRITLLAIILISSLGFAQSGAKIDFTAKDNTIDFGRISKGNDSGIRTFEFTNTGDAPLLITSVQSTAGCTILSITKDPILPGKIGKIEVKYNMAVGPIRKTLTVESNAVNYDYGRVALKLKGEVIEN